MPDDPRLRPAVLAVLESHACSGVTTELDPLLYVLGDAYHGTHPGGVEVPDELAADEARRGTVPDDVVSLTLTLDLDLPMLDDQINAVEEASANHACTNDEREYLRGALSLLQEVRRQAAPSELAVLRKLANVVQGLVEDTVLLPGMDHTDIHRDEIESFRRLLVRAGRTLK